MTGDPEPPGPVPPLPDGVGGSAAVTVLWRPGCPFCALLLRRLVRTGLAFDRVDVWEEPAAAAWVRVVTGGDETVPTVRVAGHDGDEDVALVNPTATQVLDAVARVAPAALLASSAAPGAAGRAGPLQRLRGAVLLRGRRGRARGPAAPR